MWDLSKEETGMRVRRIYIIGLSLSPSGHVFIIPVLMLIYLLDTTPSSPPPPTNKDSLIISF